MENKASQITHLADASAAQSHSRTSPGRGKQIGRQTGTATFEHYGLLAQTIADPTVVAGRHPIQRRAERHIVTDVAAKLSLRPSDVMLEIGCNVGNLLIPLSFLVARITGVDHPLCIQKCRERYGGDNLLLLAGYFPNLTIRGHFDKILAYSVVHYLANSRELFAFVGAALDLLKPGGRCLLGDIPNRDAKRRFLRTAEGRAFEKRIARLTRRHRLTDDIVSSQPIALDRIQFDDKIVLSLLGYCRQRGYHAYLLPQPLALPFGPMREDMLICRPR